MAVLDDEQSTQDAAPIELFRFVGTYQTYFRTSHPSNIVNSESTWTAASVRRSDVEEGTQEDDDIAIDIEIAITDPIVADYVINVPPPNLALQILRVHPTNLDDSLLLFDGEVVSWSIKGRVAKARVPALFSYIFNKPLPRIKYQAPCNHVLGDARCGVDMTAVENSQDTTIATINENVITVAASTFPDGECIGGRMIAASEQRMIVNNVGNTITIASPFSPNVAISDAVTIRRGCDHALNGDCINRFNNAENFGGFAYVPTSNPFNSRL